MMWMQISCQEGLCWQISCYYVKKTVSVLFILTISVYSGRISITRFGFLRHIDASMVRNRVNKIHSCATPRGTWIFHTGLKKKLVSEWSCQSRLRHGAIKLEIQSQQRKRWDTGVQVRPLNERLAANINWRNELPLITRKKTDHKTGLPCPEYLGPLWDHRTKPPKVILVEWGRQ